MSLIHYDRMPIYYDRTRFITIDHFSLSKHRTHMCFLFFKPDLLRSNADILRSTSRWCPSNNKKAIGFPSVLQTKRFTTMELFITIESPMYYDRTRFITIDDLSFYNLRTPMLFLFFKPDLLRQNANILRWKNKEVI